MRLVASAVVFAALAACSPAAAQLGPVDLSQPVRAVGTEPFWTIDIADGVLTYRDMEDFAGDITTPRTASVTPTVTGDTAVYAATLSDGKTLTLTLKAEECPDIGEETRALTSTLEIPGAMTQNACADARSAYPPEPPAT